MSGADLWFANLSGADLEHVNLSRAQLWGADLSGAKLLEANLSEADLSYANLSGAHLSFANLSGAHLSDANLSRAGLWGANLSRATLFKANLSGADLSDANLSGAHLSDSNLSGATLFKANLSGALLSDANLSGADLSRANLSNALFEPKNLPDADHIVFAKNLSQMSYKSNPQALVKLRKAFKDGGYYEQEREVTYSIQRSETRNLAHKRNFLSSFEAMFRYVFFDLTCQWGMAPGRALLILLTLILLFAIPYIITLRLPSQDGIWLKWADDRTRLDIGTQEPTRCYVGWVKAPTLGLYFSLLSAFNIGWREFNVGIWIQRLQTKEYTLKATGWVRTVSGLQSLISSYLLAIWVLTYFGRPFD